MTRVLTPDAVKRRYFREFGIATACYILSVVGAAVMLDYDAPIGVLEVVLLSMPGLFIVAMVIAMWRQFRDSDEVIRAIQGRGLLVAAFAVLALSGGWGVLELMSASVPRLPIFFVFPIFMAMFGIASGRGLGRG